MTEKLNPRIEHNTAPEVLGIAEIRVSCASFVIIRNDKCEFALLVNKKSKQKGKIIYTPIGGAIQATNDGKNELKKLLGIDDSAFERKDNDLRFKMSGAYANICLDWFLNTENREQDPRREVLEELVEEAKLLEVTDLEGMILVKVGYAFELEKQKDNDINSPPTLRLFEVFDLQLSNEALNKLIQKSTEKGSEIRFVTADEINNGRTTDDTEIGTNARALINYQYSIPDFT
jgi:hypothetical protein